MKRFVKPFYWVMFLVLCSAQTYAQTGKIIGKVVSLTDGAAVEAVAVSIKGSSVGSYTDEKGNFSFSVYSGNYTIQVSYMGSKPIEKHLSVAAGKTTNIGIVKVDVSAAKMLDEVVVDGMIKKFAQKKSDFVARMPIKNLENPQAYTVVPKELLSEQIAVDFRNVLTASPGVTAATLGVGSGGTGMAMRLRGFAGADGAGSIRNGMATNFVSLSDPANLESIEVIKGPSATLFGTNLISYGGLINRVTKRAYDGKGGEIGFVGGAWGLGRITADYNTPLDKDGKALFRVNTALHKENSYKDYGINKTFMLAPTFTFNATDRLSFTVDAEYFKSNRTTSYINLSGVEISNLDELNWDWNKSFASNDVTSKAEVLNIFAEAKYKISDSWTSQTLVSYARTDNDANYIFLDVTSKDSLSRRMMHIPSIFTTQQVQQNFNGDFYLGQFRNRLLVGMDYTKLTTVDTRATVTAYDKGTNKNTTGNIAIHGNAVPIYLDQYNMKMATPNQTRASRRFTRTYSAYASDVLTVTSRLDVLASLRFDRFDDVENNYMQTAWSPKFGLVYQILKDKVSVFGNYMNGFKNKGPGIYNENGDVKAFKPEHAFQWEAGLKMELLNRKLNSTISVYHIKVDDRLRSVKAASGSAVASYSVQDGTQVSKGVEMDVIANPIPGMHIILGYAYNDNEFTKGGAEGKRDVGTPKHLANFWISQKLISGSLKGIGFGLGGNFASGSYLDTANKYEASGYGKLDATLFYEYANVRIGAKINNLTDKRYWLVDYYAETQAPRQFLANVTYRF
ncbi:TonB-dependent receptor [uncultured Bacteroides sp.]|uniref:TonB-dependent receptor n=1 Tax=uncultured Bacteroides sp. TaxID=162156 RepID=UPI002AABF6C6|nr:TonB-dependent receptor [uncultured Bacteroides sp.]